MTLVSVVVPVFNRPEELRRALNSVLTQTIQDFEIIVVDDCSEVNIESLIGAFSDKRIIYKRLDKKGNANICRNTGLNLAQGIYTAMLDSDDEWLPYHLESKIKFLEENKADGVFSGFLIDDGTSTRKRFIRPFGEEEQFVNYILEGNTAATPTHVYYTRCAKEVRWDEKLLRHQDYDFCIRFAERFKFIPEFRFTVIVHWKKNEQRMEHLPSQIRFVEKHKQKMAEYLFTKYAREVYTLIIDRKDIQPDVKKYFRNAFLKNVHLLSLNDYLSVYKQNSGVFYRLFLRLKFSFLVLTC